MRECHVEATKTYCVQEARYSIGYFVWPRLHDVIQGPKKAYPATTMAEFMKVWLRLGFNC